MTDLMKRYESETGKQSAIVRFMAGGQALEQKSYPKLGPYDYSMDYIAWLEAKAAAYDRLMSGGKKTPKEVANFFGKPIAMDMDGEWRVFYDCIPTIKGCCWTPTEMYEYDVIPSILIDFTGDWKDSLTLPDGWEES